jgi:hypothetical protein
MTPGVRASCSGTSSPHALSQRLLEYSGSQVIKQVLTGLSSLFRRYPKVPFREQGSRIVYPGLLFLVVMGVEPVDLCPRPLTDRPSVWAKA